MTTLKEKIAVMQAFRDGVECEYRECNTDAKYHIWYSLINSGNNSLVSPSWDWMHFEYRIMPKPREAWLVINKDGSAVGQVITNGEHVAKGPFITGKATLFREVHE